MIVKVFDKQEFKKCKSLLGANDKYSAGQVTIIGGSELFHGAPILALKAVSRIVSMTYFSSHSTDRRVVENIKAGLASFVWVARKEIDNYVAKSDVVLIGPGLMRSHVREQKFVCDANGEKTKNLSLSLFEKFFNKNWVVDGGTLQVVSVNDIPKGAVITPNKKEFEMLFGEKMIDDLEERVKQVFNLAKKYDLVILTKDMVSIASDGNEVWKIEGGNDGLIKGGVGDVVAGVTAGLYAKNNSLFAVCGATYLVKKAAEKLAENRGWMFNSDDLVEMIPQVYKEAMD